MRQNSFRKKIKINFTCYLKIALALLPLANNADFESKSTKIDLNENVQKKAYTPRFDFQQKKGYPFLSRFKYGFNFYLKLLANDMEIINSIWKIEKINQPIVSIFGGGNVSPESEYAQKAYSLAKKLAEAHISVMTGAHAGIMKFANCGALASGNENVSIGISVKGINQDPNTCLQKFMSLTHFPSRKFLLIHYSSAFIIFPGGYGTLDELTEVLNLMGTKKMPKAPVILIGQSFWKKFLLWLQEEVLPINLISQEKLSLIKVTDDIDEAFNIIQEHLSKP